MKSASQKSSWRGRRPTHSTSECEGEDGEGLAELHGRFRARVGRADREGRTGGDPDQTAMRTDDPTHTLHELTSWAVDRGVALEGIEVSRPSLEDIYLRLTEQDAR